MGSVWFGSARFGVARIALARFGQARRGNKVQERLAMARFCSVGFGIGWVRNGLVWSGKVLRGMLGRG